MKRDPLAGGWRNVTPSGGNESFPRPPRVAEIFGNIQQCYSVSFGQSVWEGVPQCMGAVYAPYLGTPKHNAVVLLIYIRLFCLQKIAVIAAILQKMTFCTIAKIAAILQDVREKSPTGTGFLAADLFAVNFNSAQCAELKIFHLCLPHTCVVGCGGFVVGLE